MNTELVLHGYWRSSAAYRVRIALGLKRLDYVKVQHDLRAGVQTSAEYRVLSPQGLVPALETDQGTFVQSLAIIEWLEEIYPDPPLLPEGPVARAIVRAMADVVACDVHPLNNLRVLKTLKRDFGASQDQIDAWSARWIAEGLAALEKMVAYHGDGFCFGASPTLADCLLVPQMYNASRINFDFSPYPRLVNINDRCQSIEAFAAAHPAVQPDAEPI